MTALTAMKAALAEPEIDVAEPSRRIPHSFAMLVENLEVGEIATRAMAINDEVTLAEYDEVVTPFRVRCRNNIAPAVKRAKDAIPGADYRVEVVDALLKGGGALIVCVTRTA